MIAVAGVLSCGEADRAMVEGLLVDHIRLTLAEPGCLMFQVVADRCDPCRFLVAERFKDSAAFQAHQTRTAASAWGKATAHLQRDFQITDTDPPPAG